VVDLRLNLKTGVRPADALATLRALISEGDAVTVAAGGPSAAPAVRKAYIRWVESVEVQLAHLTHDRDVIDMLYTDRYWRISAIHESVARPIPMVTGARALV